MATKRFGLLFVLLIAVAAAKQPITPDALWDWRMPSEPQISPDGRSVVYTVGWNNRMNDAMYSNLWIATTDGKQMRPLTQGQYREGIARPAGRPTARAWLTYRTAAAGNKFT